MIKNKVLVVLLAGVFFQPAYADNNDVNSAMMQTQDCLMNKNCDSIKSSAGKAADQTAFDAVKGNAAQQQELFNISADIMPELIKRTGGDPAKMQALMEKAQTDPQGFYNSLSAETRAKIDHVANTVEKSK